MLFSFSMFAVDVTHPCSSAVVAEWLRRLTRNQFPSGSVGSNPTDCEVFIFIFLKMSKFVSEQKVVAVGRIRTYAPRGKLISSQSP